MVVGACLEKTNSGKNIIAHFALIALCGAESGHLWIPIRRGMIHHELLP